MNQAQQPEVRYPFSESKKKQEKVDFYDLMNALSYSKETGLFRWNDDHQNHRAGMLAGSKSGRGYIEITYNGYKYKAHRLAWLYSRGYWPIGQIDHINGDKTDNRIDNLRDVDASDNQMNQKAKPNKLRGAFFHKSTGRWQSSFRFRKSSTTQDCSTLKKRHMLHTLRN